MQCQTFYVLRYTKDNLFPYFHSILSYGIILWGKSAYSSDIFKIQKRIIRIIMNVTNADNYLQLFKNLKIVTLKS